jgi:hypothetical protein
MMAKTKVYKKTEILTSQADYEITDNSGIGFNLAPHNSHSKVHFDHNATSYRSYDFKPWYGVGIDLITNACQRQIERFISGLDEEIASSTIIAYCRGGLKQFLNFMLLNSATQKREFTMIDINRETVDSFIGYLDQSGISIISQKNIYNQFKAVFTTLGRRGILTLIKTGDLATFPPNPFSHSHKVSTGEAPLPKHERQQFSSAIKQAVMPIWRDNVQPTGLLLAYALIIIALHTGRNTTPLLEMERDCLRPHPKENTYFLTLWKRRGYNTSKIALRKNNNTDKFIESTPTIKINIATLIQRVITITEPLQRLAKDKLKKRVWIYTPKVGITAHKVVGLTENSLYLAFKSLVNQFSLKDSDGQPMRLNISRLRKTFANRIYELLDGDLPTTAIALGNSVRVAGHNYLRPGESAKANWKFMGNLLVQELLNKTIGDSYKQTPTGNCSDMKFGQYAPKRDGALCFSFLNCVRCKHYAVSSDDLYKLFSFYFRVIAERSRIGKQRWTKDYSHIPRLIDRDIVAEGLRRGIFKSLEVEAARQKARTKPHLFWSFDLIPALEIFS